MLGRLRDSGAARRVAAVGSRFVDTFIRENKVIPPVLAVLALLVFAWIVAGLFVDSPGEEPTSNRADLAQSEEPAPRESPAPEIENRNADSYAAYENKDPFRELLAPAEAAEETTGEDTSGEDTSGEDTTAEPGGGGGGGTGANAKDSDGDGLSDERENDLGLDPRNPDSDGDGTQDGDEETGGGRGGGSGGNGADGGAGHGKGRGNLPGSGGRLPESGGRF